MIRSRGILFIFVWFESFAVKI